MKKKQNKKKHVILIFILILTRYYSNVNKAVIFLQLIEYSDICSFENMIIFNMYFTPSECLFI